MAQPEDQQKNPLLSAPALRNPVFAAPVEQPFNNGAPDAQFPVAQAPRQPPALRNEAPPANPMRAVAETASVGETMPVGEAFRQTFPTAARWSDAAQQNLNRVVDSNAPTAQGIGAGVRAVAAPVAGAFVDAAELPGKVAGAAVNPVLDFWKGALGVQSAPVPPAPAARGSVMRQANAATPATNGQPAQPNVTANPAVQPPKAPAVKPADGTKPSRQGNPLAGGLPPEPDVAKEMAQLNAINVAMQATGVANVHPDIRLLAQQKTDQNPEANRRAMVEYNDASHSMHDGTNSLPPAAQEWVKLAQQRDALMQALDQKWKPYNDAMAKLPASKQQPVEVIRGSGRNGVIDVIDGDFGGTPSVFRSERNMYVPGVGEVPKEVYDAGKTKAYQAAQTNRMINPLADKEAMEMALKVQEGRNSAGTAAVHGQYQVKAAAEQNNRPFPGPVTQIDPMTGSVTKEGAPLVKDKAGNWVQAAPAAAASSPKKKAAFITGSLYRDASGQVRKFGGYDASGKEVWSNP